MKDLLTKQSKLKEIPQKRVSRVGKRFSDCGYPRFESCVKSINILISENQFSITKPSI